MCFPRNRFLAGARLVPTFMILIWCGLISQAAEGLDQKFANLDWAKITGSRPACLVLYDRTADHYQRYDEKRCAQPFGPCSTFKIFNTLAGIESGVLKNENTILKWDGSKQFRKSWERDHNLASAMNDSVVWYYQQVARAIGEKRMQFYLDEVGYGNRDISAGIDRFWLESSLKISADQQVEFLKRLYSGDLPFSDHAREVTRKVLIRKEWPGKVLSGKTGSAFADNAWVRGWFVGRVLNGEREYFFAMNVDGVAGTEVQGMLEQILSELGLLPNPQK